jgi:hypothetical protein
MATIRASTRSVESFLHTVTSALQSEGLVAAARTRRKAEHDFWRELGWPPAGHLPVAQLDMLIEGLREGEIDRSGVIRQIISYYSPEKLRQLLGDWLLNGWLADRVKILTTVVDLHIEGRYEASVPTLLPQIEGVVIQQAGITGRSTKSKVVKATQKLLDVHDPKIEAGYNARIAEWVEKEFFEGFTLGSGIVPSLSRNAILHGYDTAYATAENSLRCVLAFDHLQMVLAKLQMRSESKCANSEPE